MAGYGTIVNVLAVISGSLIGLIFSKGLKKRFQNIIMQSIGLSVIFIGAAGAFSCMLEVNGSALETKSVMMLIVSLVTGSIIGEFIDFEKRMNRFGEWLKEKAKGRSDPEFVEGFVTASLVVCIGAMAVVGSIQDGINKDATMLYAKSALDFVIVIIFASTMGKGVIFAAMPLGIYQGVITLLARLIEPLLTQQMISNITYVGSVLIFCIGVNLAFKQRIKVGNMLPALLCAVIYGLFV